MVTDPRSAALKAEADRLMAVNRLPEARALYARGHAQWPGDPEIMVKLSITERRLGDGKAAERLARRAVSLAPRAFPAHQALGLALHTLGDLAGAARSYGATIRLAPDFPDAHYLLGTVRQQLGRLAQAEASFRQAIALRGDYADALLGLAGVLILRGGHAEAEALLAVGLRLRPDSVEGLANLGAIREQQGRAAEALVLYDNALRLAPQRLDLVAQKAALLERLNRWTEAKALLDPISGAAQDPATALVLARIARREGRLAEAVAMIDQGLARAPGPFMAGEMNVLAGQILDQLDQPDRAFPRFQTGNRAIAAALGIDTARPPAFLDDIAQARRFLTDNLAAADPAPAEGAWPSPVFLVGFPRSGTSLLKTVLDGHPLIQSLDEKPALAAVRARFLDLARTDGADLASLTTPQLADLRQVYDREVAGLLDRRDDAVLIDKLPLNIVWAHLIWRVFPGARFILSLRHPVDACLSAYMQTFANNRAMEAFLTLRGAALTYASVMDLWDLQTRRLPLTRHEVRYEDLITDLPGQAAALLRFLGLEWDDGVLRRGGVGPGSALVNTPSYHQVARPVHQDSLDRWKRYRRHLGDLPRSLTTYAARFGYAVDDGA